MTASIKLKIAALRAKTKAAGCTEAEALAAAELAAKLMANHGLSEADLIMTEAIARGTSRRVTWRSTLEAMIAYCTNTTSVIDDLQGDCLFVGRAPGPDVAVYLRDICVRAAEREIKAFKASLVYRRRRSLATKRQAVADFREGMVIRLCSRLLKLFGPTLDHEARHASKNAVATRFAGSLVERSARPEREVRYSDAAAAGWKAGDDVALHRGVQGTDPVLSIGQRP